MHVKPVSKNSWTYKNNLSNSSVENSASNLIYRQIDSLSLYFYPKYGVANNRGIVELSKEKYQEMKLKELEILRQNPSCYFSLIHLYKLFSDLSIKFEDIQQTFSLFDNQIKESDLGKEFAEKLHTAQSVLIGKNLRNFSANTIDDSIFSSDGLKGKVYLLAFGATWCLPCKKNYPLLRSLYEKYKEQGFEIVSVNLDEHKEEWKRQIKQYKLQWINVSELKKWEQSDLVQQFNIIGVPFYLLVDEKGAIVYNSFQLKDFEGKKLEEYILKSLGYLQ